ncbi:MAG: rhomboid family intramembrane serine protease [Gemmatimonadales bacterium]
MGPDRTDGVTPWVGRLLVANVIAFLLQRTLFWEHLDLFGFAPLFVWSRPWTLVTYQFVHSGILHLAFNMVALYFFGPPVEARLGGRRFLVFYLLCGFGGAALSGLLVLLAPFGLLVGASGAVLGVAVAFAWYWPDAPVLVFPFPEPFAAKWLVTFTVAISLALAWLGAATGASDGVSHLAHLGGIGTALLILKTQDLRAARHERRLRRNSVPDAVVSSAAMVARSSDPKGRAGGAPRRSADRTQTEIDRVLDKISASGINSLTPAERKFLAEMSRRMRDRP